jgi:hypothetical protein
MRYWSCSYPDEHGRHVVETLSDDDILNEYWDYWYAKMCDKFGKEHVDTNYSKMECIDDWVTIHWAIESSTEHKDEK